MLSSSALPAPAKIHASELALQKYVAAFDVCLEIMGPYSLENPVPDCQCELSTGFVMEDQKALLRWELDQVSGSR